MRLFRPGLIAGWLYPDSIFRIKTNESLLCLTFDDGPDPDSTPKLLEILAMHNVKALFFCKGSAAEKFPDLIKRINSEGHITGNHGYNHLKGWLTSTEKYMADVERAASLIPSSFFRPPYGSLKLSQYRRLSKKYRIIFWDIMSYDFDKSFGAKNSLKILTGKLRPGSIIVLHDKPGSSVLDFLDEFIETSFGKGYRFVLP